MADIGDLRSVSAAITPYGITWGSAIGPAGDSVVMLSWWSTPTSDPADTDMSGLLLHVDLAEELGLALLEQVARHRAAGATG